MKLLREGVEVHVPVSQMTDEERRAYNREAKKRSRERAAEAEKIAQQGPPEPPDPFTLWFSNCSQRDRHDFCLTHPKFLRIDWAIQLKRLKKSITPEMVAYVVSRYSCSESDALEAIERDFLREKLATYYGLTEVEVASILNGSYKPEPMQLNEPTATAFDGTVTPNSL